MKDAIIVKDDFCEHVDVIRDSIMEAGFGSFKPDSAEMGSKYYEGICFAGRHDLIIRSLSAALNRPIFPGAMFFRGTKPGMEKSYVHSDRMHGDWTSIVYLSDHEEISGTAFYRHRRTNWTELPPPAELNRVGLLDKMSESMRRDEDWEQTDFVRGRSNRALIFRAPLFHARIPREGLGDGTDKTARLCHVCHFNL